jgi:branched-chain amino acid transport system substrate-binding protein
MNSIRQIATLCLCMFGLLASGCSKDVKVGAVISETGSLSTYGEEVRNGIDLALEEINAAGGVGGGTIAVVYRDDATNEDRGRQVTEELISQESVRIIIGAISSPVTLAIAPICEQKRVVLLSPSSSAPKISEAGDYIYRNYPSDIVEGTSMAKFAKDLGLERVVIFALDNEFGEGLAHVFTQQYESRFRQVVATYRFEDGDTASFSEMVEEAKALEPDGIYIVAYVHDTAELLVALDAAEVKTVTMATASVTQELVRAAGPSAENLVYPQGEFDVDSREPAVASFVEAYRAKYGADPDIYAAHGYDALKLIAEAIRIGESQHPDNVRMGLRGIKGYEGAAGRTVFDENGDVVRYPSIFIIRDGRPVAYDQFVEQGGSIFSES